MRGFKIPTWGRLRGIHFKERGHIIAPWLREGESAMVYAPAGVGKSMFSMSLALAVAGGGSFLGWEAPEKRRVLFVDGEMHMDDVVSRSIMLAETIDGLDLEAAGENLRIMARHYQDPGVSFPDLAEEGGRRTLLDISRKLFSGRTPADLVILDNLSTLATIKDENDAAEFNDVIRFLMDMKQAGVACVLVHHSKKGGSDYRGSSKLATTFEVILGLKKTDTLKAAMGTAFAISWDKYRGRRDETIRGREVWLDREESGRHVWRHELSSDEEAEALLSALRSLKYRTQEELAEALSWSTGKLSTLKRKAIGSKLITVGEWNALLKEARELAASEDSDTSPF